jgi:hypothetical protein
MLTPRVPDCSMTGYWQRQPWSPPSQPHSSLQAHASGSASAGEKQLQGWQVQAVQPQFGLVLWVEVFIKVSSVCGLKKVNQLTGCILSIRAAVDLYKRANSQ